MKENDKLKVQNHELAGALRYALMVMNALDGPTAAERAEATDRGDVALYNSGYPKHNKTH